MNEPQRRATDAFWQCVNIGKQLMDLHVNYEQAEPFPLVRQWTPGVEPSFYVTRMHFKDRRTLYVNESLTLAGIPLFAHDYVLGNRSAMEWIIDQYQVTRDKRSGIVSDPNRKDDPEYIVRLFCQVVTVSVETVRLTRELRERVNLDDFDLAGPLAEEEGPMREFWKR